MNRYDINLSLGRNREEMNGMLEALGKIVGDSLATLNGVSIYGMASADGSYALNDRLAKNRAGSARDWLVQNLHLSAQDARHFSVGARPEGWTPVLEAMRADGHPDTTQVAEILKKYEGQNDDVAERYIRRLACWNDIRTRYLQNDRKVVYEYTYTIKSFTTDARCWTCTASVPTRSTRKSCCACLPSSRRRKRKRRCTAPSCTTSPSRRWQPTTWRYSCCVKENPKRPDG